MPTIEISDEQHAFLEDLRKRLADEYVGEYGHVRFRDAIQYLIDGAEGERPATRLETDGSSSSSVPIDDEDRLSAMMNLLETHDDKWDASATEDGRYVVELPDGTTESVRTRDEVRAVLFKHYT